MKIKYVGEYVGESKNSHAYLISIYYLWELIFFYSFLYRFFMLISFNTLLSKQFSVEWIKKNEKKVYVFFMVISSYSNVTLNSF